MSWLSVVLGAPKEGLVEVHNHAKDYGKKPWAKTSRWWSQQRRVLTAITASLMALTDFVGSIGLLYGFKGHIYPNTAKSKRSESG
ncbi:hypothetical protein KEM48_005098 [Puccinia striiformis f. sp. tritici PST-130]|nr:hypothetical protein KEM48_005098 [Puccinia striiformis f. sp. tritici PST-130]